jgi:hypothetical protein
VRVSLFRVVACLGLLACAQTRIGEPPRAPDANEPTDAIPADLDLVARLDLAKMRRSVGDPELDALANPFREQVKNGADQRLLERALARADIVWIALRPRPVWTEADNVVVLRGDFTGFDPRPGQQVPGFRGPTDLGGGWRFYQRDPPPSRAAPVRIYARHQDWLTFVSNAEIDSTERALAGLGRPRALPPAKGAVSLLIRADLVSSWARGRLPWLADVLAGANLVTAQGELGSAGLEAEVEFGYGTHQEAETARLRLTEWVRLFAKGDGLVGRIAQALKMESVGANVVIRLMLSLQSISQVWSERTLDLDGGKHRLRDQPDPMLPREPR